MSVEDENNNEKIENGNQSQNQNENQNRLDNRNLSNVLSFCNPSSQNCQSQIKQRGNNFQDDRASHKTNHTARSEFECNSVPYHYLIRKTEIPEKHEDVSQGLVTRY